VFGRARLHAQLGADLFDRHALDVAQRKGGALERRQEAKRFVHAIRDLLGQLIQDRVVRTRELQLHLLLIAAEAGLLGLLLLGYLLLREWQWAATLPQPGYSIAARGLVMIFALGGLFNSLLIDHTESIFFAWATALLCAVPAVRGAGRSSAETPAMRLPPT